jgi:hypothetical protein
MAGRNLPSPAVCEAIRQRSFAGESAYKLARLYDLSTRTVRFILAEPSVTTLSGSEVLEQMAIPDPTAPPQISEPVPSGQREPGHTNGRAEALGGVTVNPRMPQASPVFRTTFQRFSQGTPERTEPSYPDTARGTHFNLWDPHSEY